MIKNVKSLAKGERITPDISGYMKGEGKGQCGRCEERVREKKRKTKEVAK